MKRFSIYFAMVLVGLIFLGITYASAQKKMDKEVLWAAEDIKWEQLKGGPPGVMAVTLWGNQTKGAYGGMTKFPAGFKCTASFPHVCYKDCGNQGRIYIERQKIWTWLLCLCSGRYEA